MFVFPFNCVRGLTGFCGGFLRSLRGFCGICRFCRCSIIYPRHSSSDSLSIQRFTSEVLKALDVSGDFAKVRPSPGAIFVRLKELSCRPSETKNMKHIKGFHHQKDMRLKLNFQNLKVSVLNNKMFLFKRAFQKNPFKRIYVKNIHKSDHTRTHCIFCLFFPKAFLGLHSRTLENKSPKGSSERPQIKNHLKCSPKIP